MSIFKTTRLKHELSVRDMAEIMGVSQALYRMYESGERNPKELALKKFENKFGVTITTNKTKTTLSSGYVLLSYE